MQYVSGLKFQVQDEFDLLVLPSVDKVCESGLKAEEKLNLKAKQ